MKRLRLAGLAALLAGCSRGPAAGPLPDFRMTAVTVEGERPLSRADLLGRPWVADFIFTRCSGPCPVLSLAMARLQRELPPQVLLVSFTVDPDHDDAGALARYARRFGAEPGRWLFARGDKGSLYKLLYEGFRLPILEDRDAPEGARVTHSARLVLVGPDGRVRALYDPQNPDFPQAVRSDVEALLQKEGA